MLPSARSLANIARERNVDFGLILVKYGLERILFRLSRSRHRDVFILKGALLFELWTEQRYRPTRDADCLARGDNAPERFAHIFRELCVLEVDDDGLRFDAETVEAERTSEDEVATSEVVERSLPADALAEVVKTVCMPRHNTRPQGETAATVPSGRPRRLHSNPHKKSLPSKP